MKRSIKLLVLSGVLLFATACEDDFLDKGPEEDMTLEEVFSKRAYAESFLSSTYSNLPTMWDFSGAGARNPFTGASDDMEISFPGAYSHRINSGAWNSGDSWPVNPDIWGYYYEGIRKTNIFLDNVAKVPVGDGFTENDRQNWIAEARFLRAFYHFFIMRVHGPIPIMDRTVGLDEDYSTIVRKPLEDVANFIVSECEIAAENLPMRWDQGLHYGRATKAGALALKARVLLYLASPLYNGNPDYADLKGSDGVRLFPEYDEARWEKAATAAKECIDAVEAEGYQLYREHNDPVINFQEIFQDHWNDEVFFARNLGVNPFLERLGNPIGYAGFSIWCPTQELVDQYQMINGEVPILGYNPDGSPIINPASGYQETGYAAAAHPNGYYVSGVRNMYVDREPRFYASINFSGAIWKGRAVQFWYTGADGRSKNSGTDYSVTGYLIKKHLDPTSNLPQNRASKKVWVYFRLAEQYLNYAEALNEAQGPVGDVYTYVNAVRDRGGLPTLPAGLSKDEMRERIQRERRIELSFEAHRYFDTRRWKIAEETDSGPIHGMNVTAGNSLQDDAFYQRTVVEQRVFQSPKHYLWPVPQSERNINLNLVQNPDW